MPVRRLSVRPDLDQLERQAKDLLRALHAGDLAAIAELREFHPDPVDPAGAKLADAQLVLARGYSARSWTRLVQARELSDAIWRDDVDAVREMVTRNPELLTEHVTIRDSNWGPPMTYVANLGRDRIITMLHELGATDLMGAMGRALLQSKVATARMIHRMLGSPRPPEGVSSNPRRLRSLCSCLALAAGGSCVARAPAPLAFEPAALWAEPIRDYLAVGAERFPEEFSRGITTLQVFQDRLWIGYGDATRNLGSVVPIEFRSFASPDEPSWSAATVLAGGQGAPQRTPTDTGEEQLEPYRVCAGVLCQAGVDSTDADELWTQAKSPARVIEGNFFRLEEGRWRKFRSIPGGEHVHDLAPFEGAIYAVGSGADDRAEFEGGQVFRYLWRSTDGGASFRTVHRVVYPELGKGDTRFRKLLAVGRTLYVFGYVNPYVDGGPLEGRHLRLVGGELHDLEGELARLVVQRTFELPDGTGLVVTRAADGGTRTFRAREEGFSELTDWADRRVIDVVHAREHERILVLSGDGGRPERFAVHSAPPDAREPTPILDLGTEPPSALALWQGQIFVGTAAGQIWKARPVHALPP